MSMDFDREAPEGAQSAQPAHEPGTGYRSIAERIGYREGEATERAQSSLEALIAERRKQHAPEPVLEPEPASQAGLFARVVSEEAAQPAPGGESVVEQQHVIAVAIVDETRRENAGRELEADHVGTTSEQAGLSGEHGGSGGSASDQGAGAVAGTAVAATTDMGSQAHVGGTGVESAASDSSLGGDTSSQNDEQSVGAQEPDEPDSEIPQAERETGPVPEPTSATSTPVVLVPEDESVAQPRVQQVIVQRGEPLRDAVVNKTLKFQFGDGELKQVKAVPDVLIRQLRDNLAVMTNDDFARDLPVTSLIAAFITSQLGMMLAPGVDDALEPDANTKTALTAFRGIDGRTGAIERQLAELDRVTRMTESYANRTLSTLIRYSEKSRLLENALTFLVSDRFDPVRVSGVDALRAPLTGGRYREMRDHLRRQTDQELAEEKITEGRPRR